MRILLTYFDEFGNDKLNASKEVIKALDITKFNATIKKVEIPTIRYKSLEKIEDEIINFKPDVIVSFGQAGGRKDISVERVGINVDDFRILDNGGNKPVDEKIYVDGDNAYFSTLPIRDIYNALKDNNIPVSISNTAGTFVCNHVLYGTRYLCVNKYKKIRSGFFHVPYIKGQGEPYMEKEDIIKGISLALEVIINS